MKVWELIQRLATICSYGGSNRALYMRVNGKIIPVSKGIDHFIAVGSNLDRVLVLTAEGDDWVGE
jgi:hypothetical protein